MNMVRVWREYGVNMVRMCENQDNMCDPAPNTRVVPPLDKAVVSSHVVVGADGGRRREAEGDVT